MQPRRSVLAALAGGCTVGLAGCALLQDTIERSAAPARVSDSTLGETGFEHRETTEMSYERTVEAGGESRDLRLTNWVTRYTRPITGVEAEAIRFTYLTTPTVSVAGQSVNPLQQFDEKRLVQTVVEQQQTGPVTNVTATGERTTTVLDSDVSFTEFDGETATEGVELRLSLGDTTNDGDFVVIFGLHPAVVDVSGEIYALAGGTEHPTETPQASQ